MSLTVEELAQEARKLSDEEGGELLSRLMAEYGGRPEHGVDEGVLREATRRDRAMESGRDPGIAAHDVISEMKSLLRR